MLQGFKEFISRGNAIQMAVGVIIAAAFTPIVDAITKVLLGLVAAVFGQPNFDELLQFTINNAVIQPGAILTALVNFLLVAVALYFFIVTPMNKLAALGGKEKAAEEPAAEEATEEATDVVLLREIRDLMAARQKA